MLGKLTPDQIESMLNEEFIGRIGCHAEGKTYVVPVTYAYDGESIFAHSADGMKLRMMRANPSVCFEIDHMTDMANWRSVICWGEFEELEGNEARRGMAMLMSRLLPVIASETATLHGGLGVDEHHLTDVRGRKATAFRIRLTERTGRFESRK
jgi:nitroimidazol reductase NimA-like FMN-containing flavoprotein (pyridoxamine 5'-phosphate oxidase superfamily)